MKKKTYSETYFSSDRKRAEKSGYLRYFPKSVKDWYFKNHQPRLEAALRNYAYFVPNPEGLCILEVGSGQGGFMEYCGKKNVIGIDIYEEGIKLLRAKGFDARYHDASKRFPFKDGAFDIVYTENVIEHISDGVAFIKEINRVTRRGGMVAVRTADVLRTGMDFFGDYTHVHPYTPRSLYTLLEDWGFNVIEVSHGIAPNSFFLRRIGNIAVMMPKPLRDAYFRRLCSMFSAELIAIATKR